MEEQLIQKTIALTLIDGIGTQNTKKLIDYFENADNVLRQSARSLASLSGIGQSKAESIVSQFNDVLKKAEVELKYIYDNRINLHFYKDSNLPKKLLECSDCPVLLYSKGHFDFENGKYISIVGTRNATEYGKKLCQDFVRDVSIRQADTTIISGLAYGIDICAHLSAIENDLPTIAIMAGGFAHIYPGAHKHVAELMVEKGGIITEGISSTFPERQNFLKRNRIIAGLADAVVVVESAAKGGALVTADIAHSYNRDIFTFPGRVNDTWSKGCNQLIKQQKAALIESFSDLEYLMSWDKNKIKYIQTSLFNDLTEKEQAVYSIIKKEKKLHKDLLNQFFENETSLQSILLSLECKDIIKCLPGNFFIPL